MQIESLEKVNGNQENNKNKRKEKGKDRKCLQDIQIK